MLFLLVYPAVSATFRDNDQAIILSSSWQLARHQAHFFHATFYNFDKQWAAFLGLSVLYRIFPRVDPVLAPNVMLVCLASLAWLSLAFRTGRSHNAPLPLLLPILLSPVLILYMPFFGTGWLSLAFLLLAFFFLGSVSSHFGRGAAVVALALAAACRGDVALAVPALALSQMSRGRIAGLLRRPLPWFLAAAAVLPVFAGKWMAGSRIDDTNPLSFDLRSYLVFVFFGLSPAVLGLLLIVVALFVGLSLRRRRFRLFYAAVALTPLLPLAFYSLQMYTLRYFFLTTASVLFVVSSRRSVWLYRSFVGRRPSAWRKSAAALTALTILPWLVGLHWPVLDEPRLTASNPTRFPTGDGHFPMGAYLGFAWQALFVDHEAIDHNQKIWLAARSVPYQSCPDGTVPFLYTPMSNFLEFAIRLQNKTPRPIDYLAQSPCGLAYVDVRSIFRGYRPTPRDGPLLQKRITFSSTVDNGQLIATIHSRQPRSLEAQLLEELRHAFGTRDVEVFLGNSLRIPVEPGRKYAVFSEQPCGPNGATSLIQSTWTGDSEERREATCPGPLSGWARTVLPPYMGM